MRTLVAKDTQSVNDNNDLLKYERFSPQLGCLE